MLLDSAEAFGDQASRYRSELLAHCYRMLGNIDDAEDALQEGLARAWRSREAFTQSISFRAWLYRIVTNVCLNAIKVRKRDRVDTRLAIGPSPDDLLEGVAPTEIGPEARFEAHESISLAFLTVLQVLPPRQRAVLLLRDVLTFSAAEVASLLDMSVPAVNSALQRAHATLRGNYGPRVQTPRNLLERYVRAWEAADVAGLLTLLREEAVLTMPPMPTVVGARAIGDFLAESIFPMAPLRLVERHANGGPALAMYTRDPARNRYVLFSLLVMASDGDQITRIDAFSDPRVLARFDQPIEAAVPDRI
jgi:RNA polymerase sigma factor (sigma-70 family)